MLKKRNYHDYMFDSSKIKKIIGTNVKKLRVSKGLTQEQLAEKLNMQIQSITFIETGRTFISSEALAKLCNYFNVEPGFFFKAGNIEPTEKELNLKKDINQLLSSCDYDKLMSIYNIIIALQK